MNTITDEQIAEMEQEALRKYREPLEWFVYEPSYVLALISRLRAAERDAARYRWLREQNESLSADAFVVLSQDCPADDGLRHWVGACLDTAVDAAMAPPEPNHPS